MEQQIIRLPRQEPHDSLEHRWMPKHYLGRTAGDSLRKGEYEESNTRKKRKNKRKRQILSSQCLMTVEKGYLVHISTPLIIYATLVRNRRATLAIAISFGNCPSGRLTFHLLHADCLISSTRCQQRSEFVHLPKALFHFEGGLSRQACLSRPA